MGRVMCREYEKQTKHGRYLDTTCVLRELWRDQHSQHSVWAYVWLFALKGTSAFVHNYVPYMDISHLQTLHMSPPTAQCLLMLGCASSAGHSLLGHAPWTPWYTCLIPVLVDMFYVMASVRRSSSLDWKYDRNRTEPNCKRPDHQLQLPTVGVSPVASCHVFGNI